MILYHVEIKKKLGSVTNLSKYLLIEGMRFHVISAPTKIGCLFGCTDLKFDLEVLAGSPLLKELSIYNTSFAGNV